MMNYCFFNDKIIPNNLAKLQLNDLGILRGYGVFDFLRTYNGKPFMLKENLLRFRNSAKIIGLSLRFEDEKVIEIIYKLLRRNNFVEFDIRLVLTGGPSDDLISSTTPTFYIMVSDHKDLPKKIYQQGAKLITHKHLRVLPEAKTLNYITAVMLQPEKKAAKAIDILYTNNSKILECATSNFFMFINNNLFTPKKDILLGITRKVVIKLARKKYSVIERDISVGELNNATEIFITGANKKIVPITKIDDQFIGNGKVGKNTSYVIEKFDEFVNHQ